MSFDEHIAYEARQLRCNLELLYEVWPAMHGATPTHLGAGTAYFESALIHTRNLIEFLLREGSPHEDALTPGDYGVTHYDYVSAAEYYESHAGESPDDTYARICTYVSHLSRARDLAVPSWELQPIEETLLDLLGEFANRAEEAGYDLPLLRDALNPDVKPCD